MALFVLDAAASIARNLQLNFETKRDKLRMRADGNSFTISIQPNSTVQVGGNPDYPRTIWISPSVAKDGLNLRFEPDRITHYFDATRDGWSKLTTAGFEYLLHGTVNGKAP